MSECNCVLASDHIPLSAKRLPRDGAWVLTCNHGHEFIRRDPRWERLYSLDELKERLAQPGGED